MTALRLWRVEVKRLLRSRQAQVLFLLTALSPALGLTLFKSLEATTMGLFVGNPALSGGMAGALFFAVLTIWQSDYRRRSGTQALQDAVASPLSQAIAEILALLFCAVMTLAATALVWLPFTALKAGAVFDAGTYFLAYAVLMLPQMLIAVLFCSAVYQIFRKTELTLIAFLVFAALCVLVWRENWQLCWLSPVVYTLSDDFSSCRVFRTVGWAQLTWLLGLSGVWVLSWMGVRRYGKGFFGSFACSAGKLARPAIAAILLAAAVLGFVFQPMYDHSDPDLSKYILMAEDNPYLTCSERYVNVVPDTARGSLHGHAVYTLQNSSGEGQTLELVINPGYALSGVTANGKGCAWRRTGEESSNGQVAEVELPADESIELAMDYGGFPEAWNYTSSYESGSPEISSDYMVLENWRIAPSIRNAGYAGETPSPVTVDLTLPESMTPVLFGLGEAERLCDSNGGNAAWRISDTGYNSIIYAGDYVEKDIETEGLTVSFYYGRKHEGIMERANVEGAVKNVIEYCTEHYGALSFYGDGRFKLLQTRASGGGYAVPGASSMDELDFTEQNLLDTDKGGGSGEVLIHELTHQWWGLGNMFDTSDETGEWSSEGLTVYTTYRIIKELYGEEYAEEHYVERWEKEVSDYYDNFYVRNPQYLSCLPERFRAQIANSLSGVRHYSEMPLKILKAEKLVGGEEAMDEILRGLFNRELDYSYPYLTYQDFLDACGLTKEALELD